MTFQHFGLFFLQRSFGDITNMSAPGAGRNVQAQNNTNGLVKDVNTNALARNVNTNVPAGKVRTHSTVEDINMYVRAEQAQTDASANTNMSSDNDVTNTTLYSSTQTAAVLAQLASEADQIWHRDDDAYSLMSESDESPPHKCPGTGIANISSVTGDLTLSMAATGLPDPRLNGTVTNETSTNTGVLPIDDSTMPVCAETVYRKPNKSNRLLSFIEDLDDFEFQDTIVGSNTNDSHETHNELNDNTIDDATIDNGDADSIQADNGDIQIDKGDMQGDKGVMQADKRYIKIDKRDMQGDKDVMEADKRNIRSDNGDIQMDVISEISTFFNSKQQDAMMSTSESSSLMIESSSETSIVVVRGDFTIEDLELKSPSAANSSNGNSTTSGGNLRSSTGDIAVVMSQSQSEGLSNRDHQSKPFAATAIQEVFTPQVI